MYSKLIQVCVCVCECARVCVCILCPFICQWTFRYVSCFHVLAIVNSAAMITGVCVSFQTRIFFRYMTKNGSRGSTGNCLFNILSNFHTVLHSGCTNLHSHQQGGGKVLFFSTSSPALIICRLLGDDHSDWCEIILHSFDLHFSDD